MEKRTLKLIRFQQKVISEDVQKQITEICEEAEKELAFEKARYELREELKNNIVEFENNEEEETDESE